MMRDDLAALEQALADNLHPFLDLVTQVAHHIMFSGGKRLRPLLMILSARLCGYKGDEGHRPLNGLRVPAHGHAPARRHNRRSQDPPGQPGRKPVCGGSRTAILVGDFLFGRACTIAAQNGRLPIIEVIAQNRGRHVGGRTSADAEQGQHLPFRGRVPGHDPPAKPRS